MSSTSTAETAQENGEAGDPDQGAVFVYDVEGTAYQHDRPKITGGKIMDVAGIPREQGLIRVNEDGTTTSIATDQEVHLVPKARFKRRPRFKRG